MDEMTRQSLVRRIPVGYGQHPIQFGFQPSTGRPHAMLGNLPPRIAVSQVETGLEQIPHRHRKNGLRRRPDHPHFPAAFFHMARNTLIYATLPPASSPPAAGPQTTVIL